MRSRFPYLLGIFALGAFAVLIGLGTWQMQRLHWKEDLVARITARAAQEPVPLPPTSAWASFDPGAWEYRRVEATGRFRHDLEVRVYTLLSDARGRRDGPGYWIVTPLESASGTVLVNRGFVPLDNAAPIARPEGELTVRGLLRAPEGRNPFTPDDKPTDRLFYARDPGPIAEAMGIAAAPFTIDESETPAGGLPQAGETRLTFSNRHLEYALTWYGLAAALVAVSAAFTLSRRRPR